MVVEKTEMPKSGDQRNVGGRIQLCAFLEKGFQESPHIIVSANHVKIEQRRPFQREDQSQRQADAALVNVHAAAF